MPGVPIESVWVRPLLRGSRVGGELLKKPIWASAWAAAVAIQNMKSIIFRLEPILGRMADMQNVHHIRLNGEEDSIDPASFPKQQLAQLDP